MDFKVLGTEDVTKLDKFGKPLPKEEVSERKVVKFNKFKY